MKQRGAACDAAIPQGSAAFSIGRRGFMAFQVTPVVILSLLGLVFTLYPMIVGLELSGMDGFGLAEGNAEDPDMAGAAPEGERLKLALFGVLTLFNLNAENGFASWWSAFNLAFAAGLAALVAHHMGRTSSMQRILWLGLAVIMLLLSIDEIAQVHERVNKAQFVFGVLFDGLPSRPWVIFGLAFAGLVALASIPLLLALPRRVAGLIVLSGAILVAGAVGLELIAAVLEDGGASVYSLPVMTLILIEETMEMGAIALFNIVLFNNLLPAGLGVRFAQPSEAPAVRPLVPQARADAAE